MIGNTNILLNKEHYIKSLLENYMTYKYLRTSIISKSLESQNYIIDNFCKSNGIIIDETIIDEEVSGKCSL